jgi:hypothetical protein
VIDARFVYLCVAAELFCSEILKAKEQLENINVHGKIILHEGKFHLRTGQECLEEGVDV